MSSLSNFLEQEVETIQLKELKNELYRKKADKKV